MGDRLVHRYEEQFEWLSRHRHHFEFEDERLEAFETAIKELRRASETAEARKLSWRSARLERSAAHETVRQLASELVKHARSVTTTEVNELKLRQKILSHFFSKTLRPPVEVQAFSIPNGNRIEWQSPMMSGGYFTVYKQSVPGGDYDWVGLTSCHSFEDENAKSNTYASYRIIAHRGNAKSAPSEPATLGLFIEDAA